MSLFHHPSPPTTTPHSPCGPVLFPLPLMTAFLPQVPSGTLSPSGGPFVALGITSYTEARAPHAGPNPLTHQPDDGKQQHP